jgi:stress-induced morphogen
MSEPENALANELLKRRLGADEGSRREFARAFWEKQQSTHTSVCETAEQFAVKLSDLVFSQLGGNSQISDAFHAKYTLQEYWQIWRNNLPVDHIASNSYLQRHRCVDDVYHEAYEKLHSLELTLRSSSSTPGSGQTIEGIPLGDQVDDNLED